MLTTQNEYNDKRIKALERKAKRLEKSLLLAKGKPKRIPMSKLKKDIQKVTNKIVRLKYPHICYTCDKDVTGDAQAGHHHPIGGHAATRYNFDNLRIQGSCCNLHKRGNQVVYSYRLRKEIGEDRYEALYQLAHDKKFTWTREALEELYLERKQMLYGMENPL